MAMAKLSAGERAALPNGAFVYVDSQGNRKLPIHDEPHVRNAMARFNQVRFETDEARARAFRKLLEAAIGYGIAPIGFVASEMRRARDTDQPDLPDGQVTLMLTDIEDSTGLVHRLGEEYPALLGEVRSLIREEVTTRNGYEVDARADEFFAAFPDAAHALDAALRIQWRLHDQQRRLQVHLRIGLHSGNPDRTEIGYTGIPVHTAARVCSAAHGGQILLSASTRNELGDDLPAATSLIALGSHRLRGLREPLELFQVFGSGLSDQFPPPRTDPNP